MPHPLDEVWLATVLAELRLRHKRPERGPATLSPAQPPVGAADIGGVERRQDWGRIAPDVIGFVGRAEELATLSQMR